MSDQISRDEELVQLRAENARIDEELALLRAENFRLRATQEALEVAQGPGVRVVPLLPETRPTMPNSAQMRELLAAVVGKWKDFEDVELDKFAAAFRALAGIHRQENLNSAHYAAHWTSLANQRLHGRGETSYWAFLAAALAWNDVLVSDWRHENDGYLLEFGLSEFTGRLPTDEWQRTLRGEFCTLVDKRPKRRVGTTAPRPSILVDGRQLPDEMRYVGPRYQVDF